MEIINENAGTVYVNQGRNPKIPYEHQIEAQAKLNEINKRDKFSTLLVLPTGAGKTFTAVSWLLRNAIDKNRKVLWIAHRHLLLEQACESFQTSAFENILINRSNFKFRMISGEHDHLINLKNNEDVLIASKDSLNRNLHLLDKWVDDGMYLIIDEAHHATARTYRKIKDYLDSKVNNLKVIGLTATPFRTDEKEKGLLGKIFEDDIVYDIDLKTLINKSLLARPIFEEYKTNIEVGKNLGLAALKRIERLDNIPAEIADHIASNASRNRIIVDKYLEHRQKYGKTIVFALNRVHAIALKKLFSMNDVKSEFIISGTSTEFIGIDISNKENEENIKKYKNNEIDVLINVNILTEGVDLPATHTIFLTRPTISKTLMTQMIGRGLRGEKAQGTKEAYIVFFIDDWNSSIAWINPKTVIEPVTPDRPETPPKYTRKDMWYISIKKIEEFAKLLDESIDTSELEQTEFIERIPVGMYNFSYLENEIDINCQILIYNSTKTYYEPLIQDLNDIFEHFGIEDEYIENNLLNRIIKSIENTYFDQYMVPSYNRQDIEDLLKYYAEKGIGPSFYELDYIDRQRLNIANLAKYIVDNDLGPNKQAEYLNNIWEDKNSLIKIYFSKFTYFLNQLRNELDKLTGLNNIDIPNQTRYEPRDPEKSSLIDWEKYWPEEAKAIRDLIFNRSKSANGNYVCSLCNKESDNRGNFHIDHIKPMSKGGLTEEENLQILCRSCNLKKSDVYDE